MFTTHKSIEINSGNAIFRISGQINENLFSTRGQDFFDDPTRFYDNPLITEGSRTKNETRQLSAGDVYRFSVLPTEVVLINIRSLNDNDVVITVFEFGREKTHIISGSNKFGFNIAFQNR